MRRTKLQAHCEHWAAGCGTEYCERAHRVVLYRGRVPCDVLFIGEAPGGSEDNEGVPFVGPAGHLLQQDILDHVFPHYPTVRYALTNLAGCLPQDAKYHKLGPPPDEQIMQCRPRLLEFITLCDPLAIVAVGDLAYDFAVRPGYKHSLKLPHLCGECLHILRESPGGPVCKNGHGGPEEIPIKTISITHPSHIIRQHMTMMATMIERCQRVLGNLLSELPERDP